MIRSLSRLRDQLTVPSLLRRIFPAWLLAVSIEYIMLPGELRDLTKLDGLAQMSLIRIIVVTGLCTVLMSVMACFAKTHRFERWCFVCIFAILAIAASIASATGPFLIASLLILGTLIVFAIYGWDNRPEPKSNTKQTSKGYIWITAAFTFAFFLFVVVWTVGRIYCFRAPCFDFGIFSQMFYHMKETGLPMTTVERDGLLSHFAVHVSPIFYVLLPVYWLFPTPATLQIAQAVIIASAVIPLWKIGKHFGLSSLQRMLICAVLLVYPAYSSGASYDIHENCFLTPLLLWLFYGIASKNRWLTFVMALLTLTVKEDAAVYVAVIALWLIVKNVVRSPKICWRDVLVGAALLAVAVCWFFVTTGYLSRNGDGVMSYRYDNFMYDGSTSLFTVIKSVLLNPLKAIYECVDSEKLLFIALTLLPLMGLPLLTRRYERYILLIPYVLVNLMSDYPYQHDIFFQYTFGSIAFLMYLTVVNLADMKFCWKRLCALTAAIAVGVTCSCIFVARKGLSFPLQAIKKYEYFESIRETLDTIPEEASVAATSYYATYLSQRYTLYEIQYSSTENVLSTEYIVVDPTAFSEYAPYHSKGSKNGYDNFIALLESVGYSQCPSSSDSVVIYHRE